MLNLLKFKYSSMAEGNFRKYDVMMLDNQFFNVTKGTTPEWILGTITFIERHNDKLVVYLVDDNSEINKVHIRYGSSEMERFVLSLARVKRTRVIMLLVNGLVMQKGKAVQQTGGVELPYVRIGDDGMLDSDVYDEFIKDKIETFLNR